MTTRFFAFETAGLLNQASEPHPASSRFTCFELMNLPDIYLSPLLNKASFCGREEQKRIKKHENPAAPLYRRFALQIHGRIYRRRSNSSTDKRPEKTDVLL